MRLLQFLEAIEEKHGKSVIWDNGRFFIAVNNPDKPTFFTAWTQDNEKIGTLSTKVLYKKGEPWMAVDYVDVAGGYQRQGIARAMYHVMVQGMSQEFGGLFGYGPDIASKHVGKIYKRMGAHEEDGHYYVPNPNRMNEGFSTTHTGMPTFDDMIEKPEYFRDNKNKVHEIVQMSPDEYIDRAVSGFNKFSGEREVTQDTLMRSRDPSVIDEYAKALAAGDEFPMVVLDYTRGYFSQEGLHRAAAAKKVGMDSIPVMIVVDAVTEAIDPTQLVNVDTLAFRSWFGSSKAVDDQGHPIVFFRGTAKTPRADKFGSRRSLPSFVASADIASIYSASYQKTPFGTPFGQEPAPPTFQSGAQVSPVFLSIKNPVDMRGQESINMEYEMFSTMKSDWSNWQEMELALDIMRELARAENRGVVFKYELPDLPESISVADWPEVIEWLEEHWEEANAESWGGHEAEMFTSVLSEIVVDTYAIVDAPSFTEWAAIKGFDGVVHDDIFTQGAKYSQLLLGKDVPNGLDEDDMHITWRPFDATQVKSIFNQGGWSPEPGSGMHEWKIHRKNNTFIVVDGEMGSGWDEVGKDLMERFAQEDVENLFWFWAHPQSGEIYHIAGTHTTTAVEPGSPVGLNADDYGGYDNIDIDDKRIFADAFKKGWVRSGYMNDHPAHGTDLGLHGANREIVLETLKMLLEKGLEVASVGLRGEFDGFEYDGTPEDLGAL